MPRFWTSVLDRRMTGSGAARRLPLMAGFSGYRSDWIRNDISAGVAIAAVGLPSAIAYPAIAGLPPETGIYASIWPLVAYAVFGPSRQLIVGPDAATTTILAAVLGSMLAGTQDTPEARIMAAAALSIGVGLLCLLARLLRLGVLANFLSRPILTGFLAGVSLSILVGQIGRFTGLDIHADGLVAPVLELLREFGSVHWPTLLLGTSMFLLLEAARMWRSPIPGPVLVIIVAAALSAIFGFEGRGIAVVGDIPAALPRIMIPEIGHLPLGPLVLGAAAIFLVSFGSGTVAAQSFGVRGGYAVDPNRELVGFGASNLAAGLFGAFPVSASDSRTAVNLAMKGRSQAASIVAALALAIAVLFLAPVLRIIPIAALGAILAATALSLIDLEGLARIWRVSRIEFVFALIALCGPIGLGVLNGVVIAIGATLVYVIFKLMHPRDALLGRIPGREGFYKLHRTPEAAPVEGLGICLVEGSVLFFNSDYVKSRLIAIAEGLPAGTRRLVLDAGAISQIDGTAADMLDEARVELGKRGVQLALAELHFDAREILARAGVIDRIGAELIFDNLEEACHALAGPQGSPGARGGSDARDNVREEP